MNVAWYIKAFGTFAWTFLIYFTFLEVKSLVCLDLNFLTY